MTNENSIQSHFEFVDEVGINIGEINWGNSAPPSKAEQLWISSFGKYLNFEPDKGKMSRRVSIHIADLKQATRIIVYYHYLHRGRTMAQLPYWIFVDAIPVGVILYSYPRLSAQLFGIRPLNILELARMWISPDVQGKNVIDSKGKTHAMSIASIAISRSLKVIQKDWYRKYPKLPDVYAVVSWADTTHHEGTIYKACNFTEMGQSGGSTHGNRTRPNGGRDQLNPDYDHIKTTFLYKFNNPLDEKSKNICDSEKFLNQMRLPLE